MTNLKDIKQTQKYKVPTKMVGILVLLTSTIFVGLPVYASSGSSDTSNTSGSFNRPGDVLITDQFNNRVIEVDPHTHNIVWSFGSNDPTLCNPGPGSVIGPNDAERLSGGLTLIAGTGIGAGASSQMPDGCADNRVIVVDKGGNIVWQYGQAGITGSGRNQLNVPVFAIQLPNHNFLITDQGNNRIIEVNKTHSIIWAYGPTSGPGALNAPNSAELLPNGHILIADENNNRAIEILRSGQIVWQYSSGLNVVAFASRLPNGDTLITDSGNSRIVEINSTNQVVFQYLTNKSPLSNPAPSPSNAVRLGNGNTAITDQYNHRVIVVDQNRHIVFQYGMINVAGNGTNQLNAPYSALVIGDYTGQTPPPPTF